MTPIPPLLRDLVALLRSLPAWEVPQVERGRGYEQTTPHASRRQAQRGHISDAAVEAAIAWGLEVKQGRGRRAYWLGRRAVEAAGLPEAWEGIGVVVARDGRLVTAIRCQSPSRLKTWELRASATERHRRRMRSAA